MTDQRPMGESEKFNLGFSIYQESWFRRDDRIQIRVTDDAPGGGSRGEFAIRWHWVGPALIPRIEAYVDSWDVLAWLESYGFFGRLSRLSDPSVADIAAALLDFGIEDRTEREEPAES